MGGERAKGQSRLFRGGASDAIEMHLHCVWHGRKNGNRRRSKEGRRKKTELSKIASTVPSIRTRLIECANMQIATLNLPAESTKEQQRGTLAGEWQKMRRFYRPAGRPDSVAVVEQARNAALCGLFCSRPLLRTGTVFVTYVRMSYGCT